MANKEEYVTVDKTKVKIVTGSQTQTVNVFDHTGTEGRYQEVYRLTGPDTSVDADVVGRNAPNLHALDRFLIGRGAVKEGPRP